MRKISKNIHRDFLVPYMMDNDNYYYRHEIATNMLKILLAEFHLCGDNENHKQALTEACSIK